MTGVARVLHPAIELIRCRLLKWKPINLVDGLAQLDGIEQAATNAQHVILEAFVGAEARSRGAAQSANGRPFLRGGQFDRSPDEFVVRFQTRQGGGIRFAFRRF